jgi:hypothetical protein
MTAAFGSATGLTVNDTAGNVWVQAGGGLLSGGAGYFFQFVAANCLPGANTVTCHGVGGTYDNIVFAIHEYSGGAATSPVEAITAGAGYSASSETISVTTLGANRLLHAFVATVNNNLSFAFGPTIDGVYSVALGSGQGLYLATDGTNYFTQRGVANSELPPVATTSTLGLVRPDGTSITVLDGVISAVGGGGGGAGGAGIEYDVTGSRALGTVYQNTTGSLMVVTVVAVGTATGTLLGYTSASSSPTNGVSETSAVAGFARSVTFCVPNLWYYKANVDTGGSLVCWTEWTGGGGAVSSLTTTGTSGAATLSGGVLNVPDYASSSSAITRLAQQILGSAAGSVTFSSISGAYTTLQLDIVARTDAATGFASINMQFNGDTGTNYEYNFVYASGGTPGAGQADSAACIALPNMPGSTVTANAPGVFSVRIPAYAGTTFYKGVLASIYYMTTTTEQALLTGGGWNNTAAITSIVLTPSAGNFVAGSTFTLYGLL